MIWKGVFAMSSKNIVFMIAVNAEDKKEYKYSINSWKHFCKKNNAELLLLENPVVDQNETHIIFQRYYLISLISYFSYHLLGNICLLLE